MREQDAFATIQLLRELWPALEWPARLWPAFTAELERLDLTPQQAEEALTALRMEHRWRTIEPADVLRALREKLPRHARRARGSARTDEEKFEIIRRANHLADEDRELFLSIARAQLADDPRVPRHFWDDAHCFARCWNFAEKILAAWPADWKPPERTHSWSEVSAYYASLRADCMPTKASKTPA
ncbi:MAG: hypothetical protein SFY95_06265 [Planctomycetota bacterium]|nr:hypothetical protein [Planctomycetota bacterium]